MIATCLAAMVILPGVAAGAECSCRAKGADYKLADEICLTVSGQSYMARCSMVLNNTAWVKVGDCPEARLPDNTSLGSLTANLMTSAKSMDMCEPACWSGKATQ